MLNGPFDTPFQRIKRNIARATNYLNKQEYGKAINAALIAFAHVKDCSNVYGQQRIEMRFILKEFCDKFNTTPGILLILSKLKINAQPFLKYQKGKELQLAKRLYMLGTLLEKLEKNRQKKKKMAVQQRKRLLIGKGQEYLNKGESPRGKAYLRRAAYEFRKEPAVVIDISKRLLKAKFYQEAAEIMEECRLHFPKESKLYRLIVYAYVSMHEFKKAEQVYLDALRQFGSHPMTLLNMSKLYLYWNKRDKAFEYARRALDAAPNLEEARRIMEKTA